MLYLKHWHQSGITHIKNLLNEDHSFLSYDVFQQTFHRPAGNVKSNPQKCQLKMKTCHMNPLCPKVSPPVPFMQQ